MSRQPETAQTTPFDMDASVQLATQMMERGMRSMKQQMEGMQPMMKAWTAAAEQINKDPHGLMQRQLELYQSQLALGANMMAKMLGQETTPAFEPAKDDRRFSHEGWQEPYFDVLKQSYLMTSRWLMDMVESVEGLDEKTKHQAVFYTKLVVDGLSPANFVATNPEVLSTAMSTGGESLKQGLANMMKDQTENSGVISLNDPTVYKVGENIAVTPGKVVYRNRMMELIQYAPAGDKVQAIPVLISPPWINRYYVLELSPGNSMVKYFTDQGFQVFMISWKNPDASYRDTTFDDYLKDGLLAALDACLEITGAEKAHMAGYCIGGTLLATGLAVLGAKGDKRVASGAFFTSLVEYSNPGDLGVFIDEDQLDKLDATMFERGFLDGKEMGSTMSALRSADLVWTYVVNQYLLGKQPGAFDILAWNSDSTRMPAAMHSWYLRNLYLKNKLCQPGALSLLGTPLDLGKINVPLYMLTAQNDHITPWKGCYTGFSKMGSKQPKRFVMTKAGHVAGVVSPPTPEGKPVKRSYWASDNLGSTPDSWLSGAQEKPDSWWPDLAAWWKNLDSTTVAAPKTLGSKTHKVLCDAPGTYVLEK